VRSVLESLLAKGGKHQSRRPRNQRDGRGQHVGWHRNVGTMEAWPNMASDMAMGGAALQWPGYMPSIYPPASCDPVSFSLGFGAGGWPQPDLDACAAFGMDYYAAAAAWGQFPPTLGWGLGPEAFLGTDLNGGLLLSGGAAPPTTDGGDLAEGLEDEASLSRPESPAHAARMSCSGQGYSLAMAATPKLANRDVAATPSTASPAPSASSPTAGTWAWGPAVGTPLFPDKEEHLTPPTTAGRSQVSLSALLLWATPSEEDGCCCDFEGTKHTTSKEEEAKEGKPIRLFAPDEAAAGWPPTVAPLLPSPLAPSELPPLPPGL